MVLPPLLALSSRGRVSEELQPHWLQMTSLLIPAFILLPGDAAPPAPAPAPSLHEQSMHTGNNLCLAGYVCTLCVCVCVLGEAGYNHYYPVFLIKQKR